MTDAHPYRASIDIDGEIGYTEYDLFNRLTRLEQRVKQMEQERRTERMTTRQGLLMIVRWLEQQEGWSSK